MKLFEYAVMAKNDKGELVADLNINGQVLANCDDDVKAVAVSQLKDSGYQGEMRAIKVLVRPFCS